jgi:hypothetical protein
MITMEWNELHEKFLYGTDFPAYTDNYYTNHSYYLDSGEIMSYMPLLGCERVGVTTDTPPTGP